VPPATSGQNTPPKTSPSTSPTQGAAPQGGQKAATPSAPANGSATKPEAAEATPSAVPEKPKSSIVINIDKAAQEMTVFVDGVELYSWPVSTGTRGYSTPSGTYTASSMNKIWYSKQWDNAPMPNAVFFTKEGHAIHGTLDEKNLGKPASHGCVRLSRQNAATLYALVEANGLPQTQVVLTGVTAGGEGPKVASPGRWPEDYGYGVPPWFGPGYGYPPRKKKKRGIFGRWFDPYGPQGYYAPPRDRYYPPRPRY
jgi:lipoprotein-anchoring transpeptidase ErfK/SrfK